MTKMTTTTTKLTKAELLQQVTTLQTQVATATATKDDALTIAMHRWAKAGVWFMLGISALLNGFSNSSHEKCPSQLAGWAMGIAIPVIVLILFNVAALWHKGGGKWGPRATGASAGGLLILSVWHCAHAIAVLTGSHLLLAVPMAIAIDCGLVCCKLATVAD